MGVELKAMSLLVAVLSVIGSSRSGMSPSDLDSPGSKTRASPYLAVTRPAKELV